MITVVHLITDLNVGGAERQLVELVKHSDRQLFRHVVVSMLDFGPLGAEAATAGVEVRTLGMRPGTPSLGGLISLVKLLRQVRPHILQCWMYHANLLGFLAGKLARVSRIFWGIRCSDLDFSVYSFLMRCVVVVGAWLSPFADRIVFNSEAGQKVHADWGYDLRKSVLIPNGFDLQIFRPNSEAGPSLRRELGLGEDTVLVGLIARFDPMKDHRTLLEAASLVVEQQPNVHFILAGNGVVRQNRELSSLIDKNRLNGNVHLLGVRQDIARLNAALDVACLCSYGEGLSNAVGEAMACGVPCVVTDVGDSAHLVADTGRVVPPRNPEALATAWEELIRMVPDQRRALGQRACKRIAETFAIEKVVGRYENLYRELCFFGQN